MTGHGVPWAPGAGTAGPLGPGADFGARYHIIRLLGSGGMGAVYQAWDKVLEVAVAVKVIRPEATRDPQAAEALERRFKRELLLARQVTHRNVVRIHDLGEIDGIKYITMPYIQGADLASVLEREGRLRLDRALGIARQIAAGLAAAHDAGVVHRDLKPANVMIDAEGRAQIMDFGIARSTSGAMAGTMTVGGAVVGTVEYMAPEQARGAAVDQRADIYAFGLILNDMLLGRRQTGGQTAVAELMARMQHPPAAVRSIDPTIPPPIDAIVTRCVQPDPDARYQRIADVLADLEAFDQGGTAATLPPPASGTPDAPEGRHRPSWLRLGAAAVFVLALAAAGWARFGRGGSSTSAASGPAVSLAVVPFQNRTGDPSLDSIGASLSQVLTTELGQSARVRTVPPDRLHQVLRDLRIAPNAALGPADLARVAEFTSSRRVLSGSFIRFGDSIRIDATLQDLETGQHVPLGAMAPNEAGRLSRSSPRTCGATWRRAPTSCSRS
jgi:serine/threonine protein kinase